MVPVNTDDYKGIGGLWRLARMLRRDYDINAVADLHGVLRSRVIGLAMRLHGIAVARIVKGRAEKRALTAGKIHRQLATSHDRYRDVFHRLGLDSEDDFTTIFADGDAPPFGAFPAKEPGEKRVAVAPFSQHVGKVYPLELTEQVVEQLSRLPGVKVLLFGGGEQEKKLLLPLATRYEGVVSIAHLKHRLEDELSLMATCDAMVTMDSANMHIASLVGLPAVSVWGATHPYCGFMGWRQSLDNAVQLDMECRPCSVFGNRPCRFGDYRCMRRIAPETIVEKVKRLIGI